MNTAYTFLAFSGLLTILLWTPYILSRMFVWGLPMFLHNYPSGYPAQQPQPPLWASRAHRVHLNMVETMPAFIAGYLSTAQDAELIGQLCQLFFFARLAHAVVYILGIPYLRTPVYLVSWAAVLGIGAQLLP